MRARIVVPLTGVLALAVAAGAIADSDTSGTTVQTYDQSYSTRAPHHSAGTTISMSATDPQNPRNRQPKRITNFDVTFPLGSAIKTGAIAQCKATDEDFGNATNPDDACPRGSRLGTGQAAVRLPFPSVDLPGTVHAYNATKGMLLFIDFSSLTGSQTMLLRPKFKGLKLKTAVPLTCVPPLRPDQGCRDGSGTEQAIVLTRLTLKTKPRGKQPPLLKTPKSCPSSHHWHFAAHVKYADGTTVAIPSTSRCR
jgi:hypothetical protein